MDFDKEQFTFSSLLVTMVNPVKTNDSLQGKFDRIDSSDVTINSN